MHTGISSGGLAPHWAASTQLNTPAPLPAPTRAVSPGAAKLSRFLRFGNTKLALSPLALMFSFFETSYQPGFQALSKVTANVIPRVAITRSAGERKEVLFNEVTQGATLFVSLPILSGLANPIIAKLSGVPRHLIKMENESAIAEAAKLGGEALVNKLKVAKLGKSFGASAFIAALLMGTTYLRNYRTVKRTGFSDYKKVVGLGGPPPKPTAEDKAKADAAMRKNLNIIKGLLVGGAAAFIGIMGGAGLMARRGKSFSKPLMDKLMQHWSFVGRSSNQINGPFRSQWQTLFVWGIPSYAGWLLGCRDKYEVVEQMSKFATFLAGYFFTPRIVQKVMAKRHKALLEKGAAHGAMTYTNIINHIAQADHGLAKQLLKFKNKQWGILTVSNFMLAGVLPLVFNQLFSKWRYQREHSATAQAAPQTLPSQQVPAQPTSNPNSAIPNLSTQTATNSGFTTQTAPQTTLQKTNLQHWINAQQERQQAASAPNYSTAT